MGGRPPADEATIEASERAITEFLIDFTTNCGAEKVHVIAHSMGNRGLLRALQRIAASAETRTRIKFGQIFLAAPDVGPRPVSRPWLTCTRNTANGPHCIHQTETLPSMLPQKSTEPTVPVTSRHTLWLRISIPWPSQISTSTYLATATSLKPRPCCTTSSN